MNQAKTKLVARLVCALFTCTATARAQTATTTTAPTTAPAAAPATPAAAAAPAAAPAAPTSPVSTPSMEGPLAVNVKPESFDIPDFGKIYVSGAVTAIAFPTPRYSRVRKAGMPTSAMPRSSCRRWTARASSSSRRGLLVPDCRRAVHDGGRHDEQHLRPASRRIHKVRSQRQLLDRGREMPTLIGAEYGFTYENMNISRGLLWNQEPVVSRGVQANYTAGPVAFSVSWNDGFYSDRFNWVSGAATWTINSANSLEVIGAETSARRTTARPQRPRS